LHIGSNLPPKDNLRKEDKSSAPKVSFIRRFHCSWTRASMEQSCLDHNSYNPPSSQSTVTAHSCLLLYFLGVQATWPSTYWLLTIVLI